MGLPPRLHVIYIMRNAKVWGIELYECFVEFSPSMVDIKDGH